VTSILPHAECATFCKKTNKQLFGNVREESAIVVLGGDAARVRDEAQAARSGRGNGAEEVGPQRTDEGPDGGASGRLPRGRHGRRRPPHDGGATGHRAPRAREYPRADRGRQHTRIPNFQDVPRTINWSVDCTAHF